MDGWNGMNGNVLLHTHILLERYIKNKYTSELQPPPLLLLPLPQLFSCTYHIRKPSICSHVQPMPRVCVYACGEMTFLHIADRGPNSMCIPGYTRVPNPGLHKSSSSKHYRESNPANESTCTVTVITIITITIFMEHVDRICC